MRLLRRVASLSGADRRLLLEAAAALLWARGSLLLMPFARLAARLGVPRAETLRESSPGQSAEAVRVRWALGAVARRLPWDSSCLVRALAGRRMLARRGVPCTLYLGVRRTGGSLEAHAWLRCGNGYISGDDGMAGFTPIYSYASQAGAPPHPAAGRNVPAGEQGKGL
jgi:hypothetical protein